MKILIQDRKTGLYVQNAGVLTEEIEAALCFGDPQRAMDYVQSHKVPGVRVVIENGGDEIFEPRGFK